MTVYLFISILLVIFGITTMCILLDIKRSDFTLKKVQKLSIYIFVIGFLNGLVIIFFGKEIYIKYYALWVQVPMYFGFLIVSKYRGFKLLFVLLTAISFATLPVVFISIAKILIGKHVFVILVGYLIAFILTFIFIVKVFKPSFKLILEYEENLKFWKLCIIPFIYYVYNYMRSGYNLSVYSSANVLLEESLTHVVMIVYYILLIDIFETANTKQRLMNEQAMFVSQLEASRQKMNYLENTQKQTMLYRHDIRHHLSLIQSYLKENEVEEAIQYLQEAQDGLEKITPIHYCENGAVNLVLSYFQSLARNKNVTLKMEAKLPKKLLVSDVELCALFSNGLENAIRAAKNSKQKQVYLQSMIKNNSLLVKIENSYEGEVVMKDGLPQTNRSGHGFGIKSIVEIANRWKGYCVCDAINGHFILRVVIQGAINKENKDK